MDNEQSIFLTSKRNTSVTDTREMYRKYKLKHDNGDIPALTIGEAARIGMPIFEDTNNVFPDEEEVSYVGLLE
jgi:hypothetical protein